MDVTSFLAQFPDARWATPDDNATILELYRRLSMQGGAFNITFVKDPDYFRFLRYEGPSTTCCSWRIATASPRAWPRW
jgi:hypothetical protein